MVARVIPEMRSSTRSSVQSGSGSIFYSVHVNDKGEKSDCGVSQWHDLYPEQEVRVCPWSLWMVSVMNAMRVGVMVVSMSSAQSNDNSARHVMFSLGVLVTVHVFISPLLHS